MRPHRHDLIWVSYLGAGVVLDLWRNGKKDESTLSSRTRLRCHTRPGQMVFLGGWLGLTSWLLRHILGPVWSGRAQDCR